MSTLTDYIKEIKSLWDTHWLTNMGEKHQEFKAALKDFLEVENIELLVNLQLALGLSLEALDLKGEIIVEAPYNPIMLHVIKHRGLTPVILDSAGNNINTITNTYIESIEAVITNDTCAMTIKHSPDKILDIDAIEALADTYSLKTIYDCTNVFGTKHKGKGIASYGTLSFFDFNAENNKIFNTIDGAGICYKDIDFGKKLYNLKNFGIINEEAVELIGANAKMNEFCAAMGLCNLRHLQEDSF